jgi:hypothetical protein
MKNKKSMVGGMWWIILGAIVAIAFAGIMLYIVKGGLSTGKDNIDSLASCKSRGGTCEVSCGTDKDSYFKFGGCPKDEDTTTVDNYCCIPKT